MTDLNPHSNEILRHLDDNNGASYDKSTTNSIELGLPDELYPLETQVAGHFLDNVNNSIGMLRAPGGRVLKPIYKPHLGEREIAFYESLQKTDDPTIAEMSKFIPKYFGTTELKIFDKYVKFIVLEDITEGMAEPCVMDIKIGKRTWDPLATEKKQIAEEHKYVESKRAYGLSITGFQVYSLFSGEKKKFDKNYGKSLTAEGVIEALKIFLNVSDQGRMYSPLSLGLLPTLREILQVFRVQTKFRFYSSSILLAYDARRLRHHVKLNDYEGTVSSKSVLTVGPLSLPPCFLRHLPTLPNTVVTKASPPPTYSSSDLHRMYTMTNTITNVSFDLYAEDLKYLTMSNNGKSKDEEEKERDKSLSLQKSESYVGVDGATAVDRLCRTHSSTNNFDHDSAKTKQEYLDLLRELGATSFTHIEGKQKWFRVNMIDFTHVFPVENESTLDLNYLHGIENLTKLIEMFRPRVSECIFGGYG